MPPVDPFKLLGGPYTPPRVWPGGRLFCEIRGTGIVGGWHDGPIPWPRMKNAGRAGLLASSSQRPLPGPFSPTQRLPSVAISASVKGRCRYGGVPFCPGRHFVILWLGGSRYALDRHGQIRRGFWIR